jgi:O-antigen ligase
VAGALLAIAGAILGLRRPDDAALGLVLLAPLLPGAARLLGGEVPLLFFYAAPALGVSLAVRRRRGEPSPLPRGVLRFGLAFLAVAAVSAFSSIVRGETLWRLLHARIVPHYVNGLWLTSADRTRNAILTFLVYALLLAALDAFSRLAADPRRRTRLLAAASAGGALALAAAALQPLVPSVAGADRWAVYLRTSGTFTDPNALGIGAALLAILAFVLLFEPAKDSRRARVAAILIVVLVLPVLQISGSRTGFLILALAGVLALAGLVRARAVPLRQLGLGVAAALLLAAAVWPLLPKKGNVAAGGLAARLAAAVRTGSLEATANKRLLFWRGGLDVILEEPLSGCGLGGFPYEFPVRFGRKHHPVGFTDNATNAFLDVSAEAGLPALVLALLAVIPVLVRAFDAALARQRIAVGPRLAGAALIGFAIASMTGSHLRFPEVGCLVVAVAALVLFSEGPEGKPDPDFVPPRYAAAVLVASAVVASLLVIGPTRRPEEAFQNEPWLGLYRPEPFESGGRFRWMGPAALRRVRPGESSLTLRLRNGRIDDLPVTVTVAVDGETRRGRVLAKGSEATIDIDALSDGQIVRFSARPSFVPGEGPDGRDDRALALMVLLPPGAKAP